MSNQVDDIKKRDLKSILENQYSFRFKKSNLALCPFHNDTRPSFSIKRIMEFGSFPSRKNFLVFLKKNREPG